MPTVYLAGPDVFFPEPVELGRKKKAICARYGLVGLYPLDNEIADQDPAQMAMEIYRQNCRLMDRADAIIANMTPFRGVSMDVGTAFEIGYVRAQGKLVFAYTNEASPVDYAGRMRRLGQERGAGGLVDHDGHAIEDFGLSDNLMMMGALFESTSALVTIRDVETTDAHAVFEECVRRAALRFKETR